MSRRQERIYHFDIVILGGGIAGLWLLNILTKIGFDVILVEKDAVGGVQTIASQGMLHGGQRYLLGVNNSDHARAVAPLPVRWDACLSGRGELDLSGVRVLSNTQVMWSSGGRLSRLAVNAATHVLNARAKKLSASEAPSAFGGLADYSVYELPEKVIDVASLVGVLSAGHSAYIRKGRLESLSRDGCLTVSGVQLKAQVVVCAAGLGNEELLALLGADEAETQRRPLRQFMVKSMPFSLYGHGISASYKPRVTITSHPWRSGGFIWYLGGSIADDTLSLSVDDAISYAKTEMRSLFGHLDWDGKQWSTWYGVRAEAFSNNNQLPSGPVVKEYGSTLVVWPTKLTLAPLLGDYVRSYLAARGIMPDHPRQRTEPPPLQQSLMASFPWERAEWL